MTFTPDQKILDNYADVMVNFALNGGLGLKKGEVVVLQVPESAKPLLLPLYRTVLKVGAHAILQYLPDEMERDFFKLANQEQLTFFPKKYLKARVDQADHFLTVIAETNLHELEGIDPQKIMQRRQSFQPYRLWRQHKEAQNKLTWALCLYPTQAMADEAHISLHECWQQVIRACYLDQSAPMLAWQTAQTEIFSLRKRLNSLSVDHLHIVAKDTDLNIGLDKNRSWLGCDGRNIPSFEVFISPDWRRTQGHVSFDMPLYRDGNEIRDISLEFNQGLVTKAKAKKGESYLHQMIAVKNANKIGEYSLTDTRFSKINQFMAETLFDENFGGEFGNTHLALGMAYQESFPGDISKIKKSTWNQMGYNDSVIHTDIIATTDRTVTAIMNDGSEKVIYKKGRFVL